MLGLRARTLAVPGQTQIQRAAHRGELQQGDLGTQVDPQRFVQGLQQIIGKGEVTQRGRRRTREVVGRDFLSRLGGILQRLPAGAPLAHAYAMAPSGALKVEPGRVVGIGGDGGDQAHKGGRDNQPAEHCRTIGGIRSEVSDLAGGRRGPTTPSRAWMPCDHSTGLENAAPANLSASRLYLRGTYSK